METLHHSRDLSDQDEATCYWKFHKKRNRENTEIDNDYPQYREIESEWDYQNRQYQQAKGLLK